MVILMERQRLKDLTANSGDLTTGQILQSPRLHQDDILGSAENLVQIFLFEFGEAAFEEAFFGVLAG